MIVIFMLKDEKAKNRASIKKEQNKQIDIMDIYDDYQRNEMLKNNEITAAESAFMEGREMTNKKMKKKRPSVHEDSVSVELAQEEYTED